MKLKEKKENNRINVGTIINRPNGITLIALVITIIVLIILAGVAINLTLGENGILTKAKQAKQKSEEAEAREKLEIVLLNANIEKKDNKNYNSNDFLTSFIEKENMTVNGNEVTVNGYIYLIDREKLEIINSKENNIVLAEEVFFTPENSNWNVKNVKEALDYLYNN